jgi:hypothetical protein
VPSADMLTRHSDCGSYKLCLQAFSRCFSYKIVAHLIHVLCTLARTTELVQFIEIETRRCGLKKGEVETECAGGGFMFVRLYEADVTMINRDATWTARIELAN